MDQKIKALLGEQMFAIAMLQAQLDAVTTERDALKARINALQSAGPDLPEDNS